MLREYYKQYKPKLAFEGQVRGQRYSEKSLQSILKQALQKIGIKNQSPCLGTAMLHIY
jgi:integrase/recombinase XerD